MGLYFGISPGGGRVPFALFGSHLSIHFRCFGLDPALASIGADLHIPSARRLDSPPLGNAGHFSFFRSETILYFGIL